MIYFFSSTGNSRWAAETIASLTNDRIADIAQALRDDSLVCTLKAGEALGFVFPVHGWRVPLIVREFLGELDVRNYNAQTYTYALCTAGDSIGETMSMFSQMLTDEGLHLNASYSIIMPESYIGLPFMYLDKPEGERKKRLQAEVLLKQYGEMISDKRSGEHLHKGTFPRLYSGLLGGFFYSQCVTDSHFHVDAKKCVGCGICERICPVGDIRIGSTKRPEWQGSDRCMTCYSCLHHCPENAISWGWFTKGKGQYLFKH